MELERLRHPNLAIGGGAMNPFSDPTALTILASFVESSVWFSRVSFTTSC